MDSGLFSHSVWEWLWLPAGAELSCTPCEHFERGIPGLRTQMWEKVGCAGAGTEGHPAEGPSLDSLPCRPWLAQPRHSPCSGAQGAPRHWQGCQKSCPCDSRDAKATWGCRARALHQRNSSRAGLTEWGGAAVARKRSWFESFPTIQGMSSFQELPNKKKLCLLSPSLVVWLAVTKAKHFLSRHFSSIGLAGLFFPGSHFTLSIITFNHKGCN